MKHALSCLGALEAFQFCDPSDGVGVAALLTEFTEEQSNQPAWVMMHFPPLCLRQLTRCLRAGAGSHPGRRGSLPRHLCQRNGVFISPEPVALGPRLC